MKKKTFGWKALANAMLPLIYDKIEAHDAQFPVIPARKESRVPDGVYYSRNFPARVKCAERDTILNICRQYAQQVVDRLRVGQGFVSNEMYTNSVKARSKKGGKRVSNRHIAKGCLAQVFMGRPATADDPKEYHFYTDTKDELQGAVPTKCFHGSDKDFELLIHPDVIPVAFFQAFEIPVLIRQNFESPHIPMEEWVSMVRKTPEISAKIEYNNKKISLKDSPIGELLGEDGSFSEEENPRNVGQALVFPKADGIAEKFVQSQQTGLLRIREEKNPANPPVLRGVGPSGGNTAFHALLLNGNSAIWAFATLLVESYVKKLAEAMGQTFYAREVQRAKEAALKLLMGFDQEEVSGEVDRLLKVIDHMHQWILERPDKHFVMHPSKWFDPEYAHNIEGAYRQWVVPWEAKKESWMEERGPRRVGTQQESGERRGVFGEIYEREKALSKQSDWLNLAFQLKAGYCRIHPSDTRLRNANIVKWSGEIWKLCVKDRHSVRAVVRLANWLLDSDSSRAKFWRQESGDVGIRSASGFRRNFDVMFEQMIGEELENRSRERGERSPGKIGTQQV